MPGLGQHHHTISTKSPEAQRFFDQGLTLVFAFNHEEAERSFRRASELDPRSGMAFWGVALALGSCAVDTKMEVPLAETICAKFQYRGQRSLGTLLAPERQLSSDSSRLPMQLPAMRLGKRSCT